MNKMKLSEYIAQNGDKEVSQEELNKLLGIKESKMWKPKEERYWIINDEGLIEDDYFIENGTDFKRYALGNCYKTKEEAIFARDKKLFEVKMERYLRENEDEEVDWNDFDQSKYYIQFNYNTKEIETDYWGSYSNQGTIVTTSIDLLKQFIKDNEQDIKKYLFGIT